MEIPAPPPPIFSFLVIHLSHALTSTPTLVLRTRDNLQAAKVYERRRNNLSISIRPTFESDTNTPPLHRHFLDTSPFCSFSSQLSQDCTIVKSGIKTKFFFEENFCQCLKLKFDSTRFLFWFRLRYLRCGAARAWLARV